LGQAKGRDELVRVEGQAESSQTKGRAGPA